MTATSNDPATPSNAAMRNSSNRLVTLVFMLIHIVYPVTSYSAKMGPYDIVFRHFDECPNSGTREMVQTYKIRKFNRTVTVIDANLTLLTDIDDHVSMSVDLAQFTNGGYKKGFFFKEFPAACKTFYSLSFIKAAYKAAKIYGCPVKKGVYTLTNFTSKDSVELLPVFFYNKYRGEVTFYKRNQIIGCLRGYVDFVPKQKNPKTG